MAIPARWIRIEAHAGPALPAASAGFARACAGFAHAQTARSAPAVLWTQTARELAVALVVPLKFAPGRSRRWCSWGLSPLIAAFRQAGLRAYHDADGIWSGGRRIASGEARPVGECVVVAMGFAPPSHQFLQSVRERIESQHGWQFDHAWPSAAEKEAMLEQVDVD